MPVGGGAGWASYPPAGERSNSAGVLRRPAFEAARPVHTRWVKTATTTGTTKMAMRNVHTSEFTDVLRNTASTSVEPAKKRRM